MRRKQSDSNQQPAPATLSPEETAAPFEPSAVQLARAAALKQYNWFSIYIPLLIVAVLIISAAVWMFWGTVINPDLENQRVILVSALADLVIITVTLPMIVTCLILPIAAAALATYDRKRERTRIESLQRLLWRVDGLFEKIRQKVEETTPKISKPVIQLNSKLAFIRRFFLRLKQIIIG